MTKEIFLFLVSYCIGSIPFGMVLVHFFGEGDLRKMGSGNIGATNVLRTQGKWLGGLAFVLDALKGVFACAIVTKLSACDSFLPWFGLCAVLGHCFSCFLKLRGGKGVATALGVFLFLTPLVGFLSVVIWGLVFYFSRISSLSSLLSVGFASILVWILPATHSSCKTAYSGIILIVVVKHCGNIMRLIQGTEPKFAKKCP
ncbi:MAG: glycerol-3-phosphate 1-O-acyltransferase PlsY [Holosporales bacterium]|jgi:glycerol-3-phosphate acyltransferase PlsY|nr:glycerol-3-phosphate 1-O-acyltransferase PlsY [Holosporales bacterium]